MNEKDYNSGSENHSKELSSRRNHLTGRNTKK